MARKSHFIYATSRTGTVHLVDFDQAAAESTPVPLCGKLAGSQPLRLGDETLAGGLTTCRRCRKLAGMGLSR